MIRVENLAASAACLLISSIGDPDICHGKPCIRHLRWPVEVVIDLVSSGRTMEEILIDHPELEREDIIACLQYARLLVEVDHGGFGEFNGFSFRH